MRFGRQEASRCRFISNFFNFWPILGSPWASQNGAQINKNRKKSIQKRCQQNTYFQMRFFFDFSRFGCPQIQLKSKLFTNFCLNVDFVKNSTPLKRKPIFSGLEPPKIDPKSMPTCIRKKYCQQVAKNLILGSILALFWEGFWQKNRKK